MNNAKSVSIRILVYYYDFKTNQMTTDIWPNSPRVIAFDFPVILYKFSTLNDKLLKSSKSTTGASSVILHQKIIVNLI